MIPDTDATPLGDMLIYKSFTHADYTQTHDAMLARTLERIDLKKQQDTRTPDELWVVDHNDVYTLGQAGKEEHILTRTDTPIIKTDRGGQVTWHGHGQLVLYWLFDLHSLGWGVRNLVSHAEQAIEDVLCELLGLSASGVIARARRDAPGVYLYAFDAKGREIMLGKIASLGFKIKHGFSYHGLALNIDCDLAAFNAINPCGYAGMQMLRVADFVDLPAASTLTNHAVTQKLLANIAKRHAGEIALRPIDSDFA